jgi:hypothetical protein
MKMTPTRAMMVAMSAARRVHKHNDREVQYLITRAGTARRCELSLEVFHYALAAIKLSVGADSHEYQEVWKGLEELR